MDLSFSAEHEAFRAEVRKFVEENNDKQPTSGPDTIAWQKKLIEHGYAARTIPKNMAVSAQNPTSSNPGSSLRSLVAFR